MLAINQVKKKYEKFELDCSIQVEKGCVTGLIGRNGAGKSTTFKAALGLIRTDAGKITIDGTEVDKLTVRQREDIGVVLSESSFSGYLTVSDVIPIMEAMYHNFDKKQFIGKCQEFSIPLKQQMKEFSTGMKAKIKVLLAMSHGAKFLILDEPTSGLDVVARNQILDMLRDYMESGENSILISSHISSDLEGLCDDVYMIDNGKIILHEETDVILGEYGILKVTEEQYRRIEKEHILRVKKEGYGYSCLTNQKAFYSENYPEIAIEKNNIDEVITFVIEGKELEVF